MQRTRTATAIDMQQIARRRGQLHTRHTAVYVQQAIWQSGNKPSAAQELPHLYGTTTAGYRASCAHCIQHATALDGSNLLEYGKLSAAHTTSHIHRRA
jgi:hypothetical protein